MRADYIVVGAGTAGCVLAARLSEDASASVLLLDAGGEARDPAIHDPLQWPALQGRDYDWRFETVAQARCAGRRHAWPRGRVLGGSTAINAMAHVRGHPSDFDRWAAAGCAGWGYRDLLPYFIRSERWPGGASRYHGYGGPVELLQPADPHEIVECYRAAGAARGLTPTDEHNGERMQGPTVNTLTIKDGRRQTVADAYLTAEVRARPNLTILTGALALELLFDGTRCRGLAVAEAGTRRDLIAERAVLLAAGAIGSPLLLLRSGLGPADELRALGLAARADLPGVGRNLHDHLLAGGNLYAAKRPVPPSRYQHSESLTYIGGDATRPPEIVTACVVAPVTTESFVAPAYGTAYTLLYGFTHPRSRGSLRLTSADPAVPPAIDPAYLSDDYDRRTYRDALDWARAIGGAAELEAWRGEELLPRPEDLATPVAVESFLERAAYTHHHPVGTCRMGTDEEAVVDTALAVRGVEGLRVVDGSVLPSITTGPVNAAILAIAERAADLIDGRPPLPAAPS